MDLKQCIKYETIKFFTLQGKYSQGTVLYERDKNDYKDLIPQEIPQKAPVEEETLDPEVKKLYKSIMLKIHPDKNNGVQHKFHNYIYEFVKLSKTDLDRYTNLLRCCCYYLDIDIKCDEEELLAFVVNATNWIMRQDGYCYYFFNEIERKEYIQLKKESERLVRNLDKLTTRS